jgi:hypothetical protein
MRSSRQFGHKTMLKCSDKWHRAFDRVSKGAGSFTFFFRLGLSFFLLSSEPEGFYSLLSMAAVQNSIHSDDFAQMEIVVVVPAKC